jgi:hypothetical protein
MADSRPRLIELRPFVGHKDLAYEHSNQTRQMRLVLRWEDVLVSAPGEARSPGASTARSPRLPAVAFSSTEQTGDRLSACSRCYGRADLHAARSFTALRWHQRRLGCLSLHRSGFVVDSEAEAARTASASAKSTDYRCESAWSAASPRSGWRPIVSPLYEGSVSALVTVAIELRKMPPPYRDSGYYRDKAKEARAQAAGADDPFQAMAMLEMAFVYELTAVRAEAMRNNRPRLPKHPNGQRRWRRR